MNKIELVIADDLGGLRVVLRRKTHLLLFEPLHPKKRASGEPVAQHLSIPLQPRDDGDHPGESRVHLTYPGDRDVTVAYVDFQDGFAMLRKLAEAVCDFERAGRFVAPPWLLAALGLKVWLPKRSLSQRVANLLTPFGGKYKLAKSDLVPFLGDSVWRASPLLLYRPWVQQLDQRIPVDGLPINLRYGPGWGEDGGPGWVAMPQMTHEALMGIFHGCLPAEVWGKLDLIARELGFPLQEPAATWAREAAAS